MKASNAKITFDDSVTRNLGAQGLCFKACPTACDELQSMAPIKAYYVLFPWDLECLNKNFDLKLLIFPNPLLSYLIY